MATAIQESMLPSIFPAFPEKKEFDLHASGKSVPAALFMMISKTIIQNFAMLGISLAEVLKRANDSLCAQNKMEMFVTAWIGILEMSTG